MQHGKIKAPNLFIAGAPKCGTTAFAEGLRQHPNIFVGKKEPRYFDAPVYFDDPADYPHKSLESYLKNYKSEKARQAKYSVDASVFNMYCSDGIQKILQLSPAANFIIILRDPVRAAQSMHSQRLKYTNEAMREVSEDFFDCWALIEKRREGVGFPKGCKNKNLFRYDFLYDYRPHIEKLQHHIPADQLTFIDYEVFRRNPQHVYSKVFESLGVEDLTVQSEVRNPGFLVRSNFRNKAINSLRRLLIKLPFRPKMLVSIAKNLIDVTTDKERVKKVAGDCRITEVEAYFEPSRKAMLKVLGRYSVNTAEGKRADV